MAAPPARGSWRLEKFRQATAPNARVAAPDAIAMLYRGENNGKLLIALD